MLEYFKPRINEDCKDYYEAMQHDRLIVQQCSSCGALRAPGARFCPECLSDKTNDMQVESRGKVYSFVIFHKAFADELNMDIPYVCAIVELDCGVKIITNIIDCDIHNIVCGQPVVGVFFDMADSYQILRFKLVV